MPAGKPQRPAVLFTPTPRPARAHVGYGRGCLGKLTPGACSRATCRPTPCVGRVGHSARGVCSRMSVDDSQPEVPQHGRGANTSDASGQRRRYVFAPQQERQPSGAAANSTLRVSTGRDPVVGERSSESEGNGQRQRPELGLKRPVPRPAEQARGPAAAGRAVRGPAAGWVRVDNDGGGGQGGGGEGQGAGAGAAGAGAVGRVQGAP